MGKKLAELKRNYEKLAEKYSLPEFRELNEEFDIQRLIDFESETILRDVRRLIGEKVSSHLKFMELLLNPHQAPLFILKILKNLSLGDKERIHAVYAQLCKVELNILLLENNYSEEKEAEFIKKFFKKWKVMKKEINAIINDLIKSWDKESEKSEKSYFG